MEVSEDGAAVDDVVGAVKEAIKIAGISSTDNDRDLRVTSVQLVLKTIASVTTGGGVDFRIPFLGMSLKVGASVTTQDTHTLDISLVPPNFGPQHEVRDGDVAAVLADSVSTIRALLARASGGDDPFELQTGLVELNFAVTRDGSITLGFNGELHGQVTHTLRMGIEAA
jgi:Trypsin-co-occurring domain 2